MLKDRLAKDPRPPLMAFAHVRLEMQLDKLLAPYVQDPVCHQELVPWWAREEPDEPFGQSDEYVE